MGDGLGFFAASGLMIVNEATYQFLERGVLSPDGRVVIRRGAVDTTETAMTQEEFDGLVKTAKQIMDSFKIE